MTGGTQVRIVSDNIDTYATYGRELGRGGEGAVHALNVDNLVAGELVAKRYHDTVLAQRGDELRAKLSAMCESVPAGTSTAWPQAVVYERAGDQGKFSGFAMAAISLDTSVLWGVAAHAAQRRTTMPEFGVRHALRASANLAAALDSVHRAGGVVGDINESNIMVRSDATVVLVDCDSAQFSSHGHTWRCTVGKEEFTAPELVGVNFADIDRSATTDVFAYAVCVYQLIYGGSHPFDAVSNNLDIDLPPIAQRIKNGAMVGVTGPVGDLRPVPRLAFGAAPRRLQPLFAASLGAAGGRPALSVWRSTIGDIEQHLVTCGQSGHAHDSRDGQCGWCAHTHNGGADSWSNQTATQQPHTANAQQGLTAIGVNQLAAPNVTRTAAAPQQSQWVQPGTHSQHYATTQQPQSAMYSSVPGTNQNMAYEQPDDVISGRSWSEIAIKHPVVLWRHIRSLLWRGALKPAGYGTGGNTTIIATLAAATIATLVVGAAAYMFVRAGSVAPWYAVARIAAMLAWFGSVAGLAGATAMVVRYRGTLERNDIARGVGRVVFGTLAASVGVVLVAIWSMFATVLSIIGMFNGRYDR